MRTVRTDRFNDWLQGFRDKETRTRIQKRVDRIDQNQHLGITRSVGDGVYELKLDFGPGYRVYYSLHCRELILLLAGGDKSSQQDDVREAKRIKTEFEV